MSLMAMAQSNFNVNEMKKLPDDVSMPVDDRGDLYSGVDSGICFPIWHCAFRGCTVNQHTGC